MANLHEITDANIVPNGIKGITGQGLNNTLHAFADEIESKGSGSGSGAEKIFLVPYELLGTNFNQEEFDLALQDIEAFGVDCSFIRQTMTEQLAHNAQMYAKIVENVKSYKSSLFMNDSSLISIMSDSLASILLGVDASLVESFATVEDHPLSLSAVLEIVTGEMDNKTIKISFVGNDGYTQVYEMHEDGSISFVGKGGDFIYCPESTSVSLTEEAKQHNVAMLSVDSYGEKVVRIVMKTSGGGQQAGGPRVLHTTVIDSAVNFTFIDAYSGTQKLCKASVDTLTGDTTLTVLGTLNLS